MAINAEALAGMTREQLLALVTQMAQQPARKVSFKVSEKGALSVYGLGKFPVTLYRTQWERLQSDEVRSQMAEFIKVNSALLTVKA